MTQQQALPTNRGDAIAQHAAAVQFAEAAKRAWDAACEARDFANADRLQEEMHAAYEARKVAGRNRSRFCF